MTSKQSPQRKELHRTAENAARKLSEARSSARKNKYAERAIGEAVGFDHGTRAARNAKQQSALRLGTAVWK